MHAMKAILVDKTEVLLAKQTSAIPTDFSVYCQIRHETVRLPE
jgi:hypothetical protein